MDKSRFLLPIVSLLICEVLLRLIGYKPIPHPIPQVVGGLYAADELTGWRNGEGKHTQHLSDPAGNKIRDTVISFRADGTRICPNQANADGKKLIFVGDSYLQGGGLNDADTMTCKLQALRPDLQITNFGTGGYGTCQSFLRMRELASHPEFNNASFVYGLNDFHEERNIASPIYAWRLAKFSASKTIFMPYCGLDKSKKIKFFPPEEFSTLMPFDQYSSLLTLTEEIYYEFKSKLRGSKQQAVTEELLVEMKELTDEHQQKFTVFLMDASPEKRAHYLEFLKAYQIPVVDGFHPHQSDKSMRIPYDQHPNEILNDYWAKLLARQLPPWERGHNKSFCFCLSASTFELLQAFKRTNSSRSSHYVRAPGGGKNLRHRLETNSHSHHG